MQTYAASTTVQASGEVRLAGVPFEPGTEVDVTISRKLQSTEQAPVVNDEALGAARDRMRELFNTIKGFRNSPRIPREELCERGSLR